MPKRTDIKKILLIGSGPIIISQACEFDYSGTQACKALKEEGYQVVLVNSNPATIMTDPEFADRTYIEPVTPDIVEKIIAAERPDALLPTLGGQTALNVTVALGERGVFKKYGVELIGASLKAIKKAEDRQLFKNAMQKIGLDVPKSVEAKSVGVAEKFAKKIGFPVIIRPAFTLGGTGGGIAYNMDELRSITSDGIKLSPIGQVLVEESVLGWKEYELEVMRDTKDNVVIICSIENFDPMGVHTGDSITVAPAQTLTDKEYQRLRDYSIAVIREIGVDTGGSNIQFAVNPKTGRVVIIEMNPRVSRSSALASKATGFPIAKMAAKLAVGYTLDEIPNDITKKTPASFEPTIDYVVTKIPRFAFEKFPESDPTLNIQMKSVGEAMAIGRTFKESLQKALRSLEIDMTGLEDPKIPKTAASTTVGPKGRQMSIYEVVAAPKNGKHSAEDDLKLLESQVARPTPERIFYVKKALSLGMAPERIVALSWIDPWFIDQMKQITDMEKKLAELSLSDSRVTAALFKEAKRMGFSDAHLAKLWKTQEPLVRAKRKDRGVFPSYKTVDTCGAEFEAMTPYYYSTYDGNDEMVHSKKQKIMILGGGPNRIGQGIEFDYCCVHASFALKADGYETIMVNCNPETVSTDYDTSDRLYFEPMTYEDILNIVEREKPMGVIVQFGGQTPLKLAVPLEKAGVKLLGTSSNSIDMAEDRKRFEGLLRRLNIPRPANGTVLSVDEALRVANKIGYPVLVRPSYVLGGRSMEIVYDDGALINYMASAVDVSASRPVLIDKFLEDAIEVDVDAVSDGRDVVIAGIMEHIEEAGIHSGDSACVIPTLSLSDTLLKRIREVTVILAKRLKVIGLLNIQFAIKDNTVFVLEVNPRASRTIPFVSKATGIPWAKVAARVMGGKTLKKLGVKEKVPEHISVKEVVLPFARFTLQDTVLGPEMKSTGEVMGIGRDFGEAFAKAQLGAGEVLNRTGAAFVSVRDRDKASIIAVVKDLTKLGFEIIATEGTARALQKENLDVRVVRKAHEERPNIVDVIRSGEVSVVINTPLGKGPRTDGYHIRRQALLHKVMCVTTVPGASALVKGFHSIRKKDFSVRALQHYHKQGR